ncbi:putative glycoside hydrolase [Flammeovirga agarivorans]|uniref:Glycoside-hydrolase family GH114 TIM-barrel domain-containing protein n=1 Tax=Flammeovirga agarivorans TaxID=2726742 RepID=A0A7X8SNT9_9BACT|nr:putative glycoside hydrolase [Flammeovirga agarivorans]NLR93624.1 hypothetical protein [Flammeovirga agarivorans]
MKLKTLLLLLSLTSFLSKAQNIEIKHNWDKMPLFFHFGQVEHELNKEQVKFVAERTNIVALEKRHAFVENKNTEDGIYKDARKLRKVNPDAKVIFYWNAFLNYPFYDANSEYDKHDEWWLKNSDGTLDYKPKTKNLKRYDLSNEKVRSWWVSVAKSAIKKGCDGIFMDAFMQVGSKVNERKWGKEKYDAIQKGVFQLMEELRAAIGNDQMIIYNGVRSLRGETKGMQYLPYADAAMIEHFGYFHSESKEMMLADIKAIQEIGKANKMALVKGWPGFAWMDKDKMVLSFKEKEELSKKALPFALGSFLMGADDKAYFSYSWGYHYEHGFEIDYELFKKAPGKPTGAFKQNGWVLTREFENVVITVDLENKTANYDWKIQ